MCLCVCGRGWEGGGGGGGAPGTIMIPGVTMAILRAGSDLELRHRGRHNLAANCTKSSTHV